MERDRRKSIQRRVIRNKTFSPIIFLRVPSGATAGGGSLNLIGRVLGSRCALGRVRDTQFTRLKAHHVLVLEDRQNIMADDMSGLKQVGEPRTFI